MFIQIAPKAKVYVTEADVEFIKAHTRESFSHQLFDFYLKKKHGNLILSPIFLIIISMWQKRRPVRGGRKTCSKLICCKTKVLSNTFVEQINFVKE